MGKLAVSAEYPVYEINKKVADPDYLAIVFRSTPFMRLLERAIPWRIHQDSDPALEFERQRIPLPPLPVQRKIVAAWEAARKSAAATAAKIEQLERDIEAGFLADLGLKAPAQTTLPKVFAVWWSELERWSVMFNQLASVAVDISGGKFSVANLGDLAMVSYGIQKCPLIDLANIPARTCEWPTCKGTNWTCGKSSTSTYRTRSLPAYGLNWATCLFARAISPTLSAGPLCGVERSPIVFIRIIF